MKRQRNSKHTPAGFTLIELLVVIAIIGILMSLVSAAVFRVYESQKDANSQGTVAKVNDAFLKHWKSVIDSARTEDIPAAVTNQFGGGSPQWGLLAMATGDRRALPAAATRTSVEAERIQKRLRLLWIKLRLQQEFPMCFAEALNPTPTGPQLAPPIPGTAGVPFLNPNAPANRYANTTLAPRATYVRTLAGATPGVHNETSAMLYMALKQSRRGTSTAIDEMLASTEKNQRFTDGLDEIADAWGNPIVFFRWPTASNDPMLNDPAYSGFLGPHSPPALYPLDSDPTDPERLLSANVTILNAAGGAVITVPWHASWGGIAFQRICHAVPAGNYMTPVIMSYGRNGRSGVGYAPANWPAPTPMLDDGTGDANDNIFSYRLRLGGKGN